MTEYLIGLPLALKGSFEEADSPAKIRPVAFIPPQIRRADRTRYLASHFIE
jgi:hypothetical protein